MAIDANEFGGGAVLEVVEPDTAEPLTAEEQAALDALDLDALYAHGSYTPAVGEQFTPDMAQKFFDRYFGEIQEEVASLMVAMADEGTEHALAFELTPDLLLKWRNGSLPYLRGHSDHEIEVARISFLDIDGTTKRARLMLEFDTEILRWVGIVLED